jgi:type I restriction enzyme S subunit
MIQPNTNIVSAKQKTAIDRDFYGSTLDREIAIGCSQAKLRDLCKNSTTINPEKAPGQIFKYIDVSGVSNQLFKIVETKEIMGKEAPSRARKHILAGDVIFATVRPTLQRIAIIPPELNDQICSTGFCVLRAKDNLLDHNYLYFYLLTERVNQYVASLEKGATYPAINDGELFDLTIPLPPLSEQRAIAHILYVIQNATQACRKELELERERKVALMQHLFIYGTRGEPTMLTEIGEMPDNWPIVRLGEIFETQLGKMLSQKAKVGKSSRPYMRNANVQWGRVNCEDVLTMDFDEREMEKFRLRYGDILVCEGGEIGRTAIWRDELPECYFQKAVHRLRPIENQMLPTFFLHYMERAFRHENIYGIAGAQTTIAHLPQDKLSAMYIPKPPIAEQKEIAQVLDTCDTKIAALEKEITLYEELFRTLLEELMTGRLSALPLVE